MKAQVPAEGILKTSDWGDSKFYHVVCGCGQPDHSLSVEVEADDCGVNVNTYVKVKTDYWSEFVKKRYDIDNPYLQELDWAVKDIWNGLLTRLKLTWTVWTKGYVSCESTITMSKQQSLNFAETLKSAIKDVEAFEKGNTAGNKQNAEAVREANQGDCV
jgi:hypothetical protein